MGNKNARDGHWPLVWSGKQCELRRHYCIYVWSLVVYAKGKVWTHTNTNRHIYTYRYRHQEIHIYTCRVIIRPKEIKSHEERSGRVSRCLCADGMNEWQHNGTPEWRNNNNKIYRTIFAVIAIWSWLCVFMSHRSSNTAHNSIIILSKTNIIYIYRTCFVHSSYR